MKKIAVIAAVAIAALILTGEWIPVCDGIGAAGIRKVIYILTTGEKAV
ncbi:MAG TPA: hypothetical protein VN580_07625 [Clostridia bacterium]|nr:hypothetical protein [Clostridia bacterium]